MQGFLIEVCARLQSIRIVSAVMKGSVEPAIHGAFVNRLDCISRSLRRRMEKPFSAYKGSEPYVFVCYAHKI